mmetsp:Transcript_43/g.66  ORF Transcript_43/g.66 Transcript_43/m.66 type:complete len:221 (+) Transcript_43:104-766(+)
MALCVSSFRACIVNCKVHRVHTLQSQAAVYYLSQDGSTVSIILQQDQNILHPRTILADLSSILIQLNHFNNPLPAIVILQISLNSLQLLLLITPILGDTGFTLLLTLSLKPRKILLCLLNSRALQCILFIFAFFQSDLPLIVPESHGGKVIGNVIVALFDLFDSGSECSLCISGRGRIFHHHDGGHGFVGHGFFGDHDGRGCSVDFANVVAGRGLRWWGA